jgi:hypothetical protein
MHLRADGLNGNIEPAGGLGHAAFLGHHPKVMQVPVIKGLCHAFLTMIYSEFPRIIG